MRRANPARGESPPGQTACVDSVDVQRRGVLLPVSSTARTLSECADADVVLTAMKQVLAAGSVVPTAGGRPSQAIHALEAALPPEFATRDGHRRVKVALLRLQRAEQHVAQIEPSTDKSENRNNTGTCRMTASPLTPLRFEGLPARTRVL